MKPRIIFVGGGVRSGKSRFAQDLALERGERRLFVATAQAFDTEMKDRISAHQNERGDDFTTAEEPIEIQRTVLRCMEKSPYDVLVIDCLTLWLSNMLMNNFSDEEISERCEILLSSLGTLPCQSILVSNEVGMGIVPEHPLGRRFRDQMGRVHQQLAASSHEIYLATMGCILRLKPSPISLMDPTKKD